MAMFDDPKKELAKLEKQLLKDEDWLDRELAAARALIGEEPAKKPAKKPAQKPAPVRGSQETQAKAAKVVMPASQDVNLDEKKQTKPKKAAAPAKKKKAKKSNRGLVILAVLETLGILGVVGYWLMLIL